MHALNNGCERIVAERPTGMQAKWEADPTLIRSLIDSSTEKAICALSELKLPPGVFQVYPVSVDSD